jgi:TAT (twin-arginine translocation) pathway signal sequence
MDRRQFLRSSGATALVTGLPGLLKDVAMLGGYQSMELDFTDYPSHSSKSLRP